MLRLDERLRRVRPREAGPRGRLELLRLRRKRRRVLVRDRVLPHLLDHPVPVSTSRLEKPNEPHHPALRPDLIGAIRVEVTFPLILRHRRTSRSHSTAHVTTVSDHDVHLFSAHRVVEEGHDRPVAGLHLVVVESLPARSLGPRDPLSNRGPVRPPTVLLS